MPVGFPLSTLSNRIKPSIIGTRGCTAFGTNYSTAQAGIDGRTSHYLPYGATALAPVYAGWGQKFAAGDSSQLPNGNFYAADASVGAGGTGYNVGDLFKPTVAANQISPQMMVLAVTAGIVTAVTVLSPGMFNAQPAAALATIKSTGAGDNGLTVTLSIKPCAVALNVAIEQVLGTQSIYSNNNTNGVLPATQGFNQQLGEKTIIVPSGSISSIDLLPVTGLLAGANIALRYAGNGSGMQRNYPALAAERDGGNSFTIFNAGTVYDGVMTATGGSASLPAAIIGFTTNPAPSIINGSDSIGYGTASQISGGGTAFDTVDAYGNSGYITKAIGIKQPFTTMAQSGEAVSDWLNINNNERWNFLNNVNITDFIDSLGTNDISGGLAYATFIARKIGFWQRLRGAGVKRIRLTTITPYGTSTSGISILPTIAAGGTGYALSSTFTVTIAGGTGTAATLSVTTNGAGVVTTVNSILTIGYYTALPATPNTPTGGSGTGLQLNLIFAKGLDVTSQTVGVGNATRTTYNQAVRANAFAQYGIVGYFDSSPYIETAIDSGIWLPGSTYDVVHPSNTAHNTLAIAYGPSFVSIAY